MVLVSEGNPWPRYIDDLRGREPVAQNLAFLELRRQLRRCLGSLWGSLSDPDGLVDESITQVLVGEKEPRHGSTYTAAWLCTVVRNAAKDLLRRQGIWRRKEQLIVASEEAATRAPEQELLFVQIRHALEDLEPELRKVVELRYIQEMKLEDVAEQLGVATSTAWKREKQALKVLKDVLS